MCYSRQLLLHDHATGTQESLRRGSATASSSRQVMELVARDHVEVKGRDIIAQGIRIVVADAHAIVREGMRSLFDGQDDMSVVGDAGNGEKALELVEQLAPDVIVLDVRMPKVDGIEVARRLRGRHDRIRILVVSAYNLTEYVMSMMEAGADGYIMKTASPSQLIDAVRRVHEDECVLDPEISLIIARQWAGKQAIGDMPPEPLTRRERRVLQLATQGLANRAIAAELGLSIRTVQRHFSNIYGKLGVSSRIQVVLHALSAGPSDVDRNRRGHLQMQPFTRPGQPSLAIAGVSGGR